MFNFSKGKMAATMTLIEKADAELTKAREEHK